MIWDQDRYIKELQDNPLASLAIHEVMVHVDSDVAIVSARTSTRPDRYNRYIDTYARREDEWVCVHACVWPLE